MVLIYYHHYHQNLQCDKPPHLVLPWAISQVTWTCIYDILSNRHMPSVVLNACTQEESGAIYFTEVANNYKLATERIESKFSPGCKLQYWRSCFIRQHWVIVCWRSNCTAFMILIWVVLLEFLAIGMFSFLLDCRCCWCNLVLWLLDWCIMLLCWY